MATIDQSLSRADGVGELIGRTDVNTCQQGQHNWKINDKFDVLCRVMSFRTYLVQADTFRAAANSVTDRFRACEVTNADRTMAEYWDTTAGKKLEGFPTVYIPDYLPTYDFGCGPPSELTAEIPRVTGWVQLPPTTPLYGDPLYPWIDIDSVTATTGDSMATILAKVKGRTGWLVVLEEGANTRGNRPKSSRYAGLGL